ncbi:MAG TPA: TonB-dependent receptor [Stellaceae bacterium]|nr:TonB-dependent receptor [Stellaceae bacterium]
MLAWHGAARAQEPTLPEFPVPEIVVTGSTLGISDTASQGTVSGAQLEERPAYRVGELLESVPGLIVTQHSGEGKANQYFLRSFNLDHGTDIAITLDGMPVNLRTHAHGQGYADLNFMIPELVDALRYSKGPYFADQGDFATAGAVAIDYVDALPRDLASIGVGTEGDYRGLAAASRLWGTGTLLIGFEYDHLDGPWLIPDNFNKGNAVVRYSRGTRENGFSLTGMYMNDAFHATNQIATRAVAEGLVSRFGAIDPSDGGSSERYSLSGRYAVTTADAALKLDAYAVGYSLQLFNDFDYFATFPPPLGDQFVQQDRRKIYGGNWSYARFGSLFGFDTTSTIGLQARSDDVHAGLAESTDRMVRFTVRDDHVVETSAGLYGENRITWGDTLRTIAGVREDVFHGSDASTLAANSGTLTRTMTSPKGTVVLGPWRETEYYLSVGQGFHSNDLRGALTTVDALQTELDQQKGVAAVVPQGKTPLLTKATGYEVGVRSEIVPRLKAEAALYVLALDSEATFDGDEAVTTPGRPSRRQGIELSAAYAPFDWLTIDGDFAFTRARYANADAGAGDTEPGHPGSYIPGAAKMVGSAGVMIGNLGPWSGEVHFRYFGPRPLIEDNSVSSGPTALFDAQVGYRLSERAKLRLDLYNLFNSRAHQIDYYYPSQLAGEAAPVYDIHFHPVEPLSARFTLALEF